MFPNLSNILKTISLDNYGYAGHYDCLVGSLPQSLVEELECMAAKMTEKEQETFAEGEESDLLKLVSTYKISKLYQFVNEAFDAPQGWITNWV